MKLPLGSARGLRVTKQTKQGELEEDFVGGYLPTLDTQWKALVTSHVTYKIFEKLTNSKVVIQRRAALG